MLSYRWFMACPLLLNSHLEILSNAVDSMPTYSITPSTPEHPAPAAHHTIHSLAVMTSHLLSYPVHTITDSQADRMELYT